MKEGWEYIELSKKCKVQNGFAFNSKEFNCINGLPLIRIRDIKRGFSETYTNEYCSSDYIVENGDLLVGMDGDFNVGIWKGGHALLNQRVCMIKPLNNYNIKFLYYYLPNILNRINQKTSFSTVKHLSSKQVNKINIPDIIIDEQRRIVSYLDSSFKLIDEIKDKALKSLTEAKALFQSALAEAMEPKEGWEEKTLGEIADVIHGKNQKDVIDDNGIYPIYGSGGHIMGYANNFLCKAGSTILGRKGTIDKPIFIDHNFWNVDTAFGISAKHGHNSKYIFYLCSNIDWKELNTGTTIPSLTQSVVKGQRIVFHTISTQKQIVSYLDSLSSNVRQMEEKYQKMVEECDALKQAMLRDVFE